MQPANPLRLFIALPVPEPAGRALSAYAVKFRGLRFAKNLHLTLTFIGNVPASDPYESALASVHGRPFSILVDCLGIFRQGILWAGANPNPDLLALKSAIDAALGPTGLIAEKRLYKPHITLSRFSPGRAAEFAKITDSLNPNLSWLADRFILYKSTLAPTGAIHEIIREFALAG